VRNKHVMLAASAKQEVQCFTALIVTGTNRNFPNYLQGGSFTKVFTTCAIFEYDVVTHQLSAVVDSPQFIGGSLVEIQLSRRPIVGWRRDETWSVDSQENR